ncbi:hypothetical protein HOY82DRAFT_119765 [Tuber indicum]|nr:hypothetical protein HOY82DRAFT_119765 [Tuber indicum]
MPEVATHTLEEYHNDIYQSSDCCTIALPPTCQRIDRTFSSLALVPARTIGRMEIHYEDSMVFEKGRAPIELLPVEIFDQIIPQLVTDEPTNGYSPRNKDLASCLLVSRTFHIATLSTLYSKVAFPHSIIFDKFLVQISKYPELGHLVKRLDFSHFTSVGFGRTERMNSEIQKLTATTLRNCLDITPNLREFLASEAMGRDVDERVLEKLFCELPRLNAVDFCATAGSCFKNGFLSVISPSNLRLPIALPIRRLGMHGCNTLPSSVYATLLPRLPNLTHLDLTHTQVTDETLHAIPHTAKLTHLSLSRCNRLTGPAVVDFLINHPATRDLVYLNLLFDTGRYRLLSTTDVDVLLPFLPTTLRSLNLSGAKITRDHIPDLRRLSKHLEELSIGYADLNIADLNTIVEQDGPRHGGAKSNLHYLDLTGISSVNPTALVDTNRCKLLTPSSFPLQVLELSEKVTDGLKERPISTKKLGWNVESEHRRAWYLRAGPGTTPGSEKIAKPLAEETGFRSWKMGGKLWGGRKVGVGYGKVTGMYDYYGYRY